MKKVLLTGADGFIGSHLAEYLVEKGYAVKAFVYYNSINSKGWLDALRAELLREIEIFSGDVRDAYSVLNAMEGCSSVLHLAALNHAHQHAVNSYVDTNINGTLSILQAARKLGLERVLIASSSEVYGNAQYIPIDEDHLSNGQSPCAATKLAADKIAQSFYHTYNVPVSIVRPFSAYGPRQSIQAIIPSIIAQLLSGDDEIKLANQEAVYDFVHVNDIASAFEAVLYSTDTIGAELNVATGEGNSSGFIAGQLIDMINPSACLSSEFNNPSPEEHCRFNQVGDSSRLKRLTGWASQVSLEEGLQQTINWYRNEAPSLGLFKSRSVRP